MTIEEKKKILFDAFNYDGSIGIVFLKHDGRMGLPDMLKLFEKTFEVAIYQAKPRVSDNDINCIFKLHDERILIEFGNFSESAIPVYEFINSVLEKVKESDKKNK